MGKNPFHMTVWISLLVYIPICLSKMVQIIKPRVSLQPGGFKEKAEAELSLFSASLGFMDDEHLLYSTPTHNFFKKYLRMIKWHEAADTKITKKYFNGHGVKVCSAYLSDPIFKENGISLLYYKSDTNTFMTELKVVRFRYSTRNTSAVKVVKCPIQRRNKVTGSSEESKLYFQEIRYSDSGSLNFHRGYFVFANIKRKWAHDDPLEFLMYTSSNRLRLPTLEEADEEVKFQRSKEPIIKGLTIKFQVKAHIRTSETGIRLFGEEAEIVFLTKMYGFVNTALPLWQTRKFLKIMDRLKQEYEVNAAKMQRVRKSKVETVCKNYIEHNNQLRQHQIRLRKEIKDKKIGWVSKKVQFPDSNLLSEGRTLEILQCPATFTGGFLYLWPVHYMNLKKRAQVFTFREVGRYTNQVIPFILSPVNENDFEKYTEIPRTSRRGEEKNTDKISKPPQVESSSHHSPPDLTDLQDTETISDPAQVASSQHLLLQDLIDFTDLSQQWTDFGEDLPKDWEKFDKEEAGGK